MKKLKVDLRSDTVSQPDHAMLNAMTRAELGDDVFGEDPTVNHLEETVADMAGFERGVFMPTGTMSNGVAIRSMTMPGDEVISGSSSHIYNYESGQYGALAGVQIHRLDEMEDGCLPSGKLEEALARGSNSHFAPRTLVTLENTHNILGGLVLPSDSVADIANVCVSRNVSLYLDGARAWHAAVASKTTLRNLLKHYRMVSMCFSKALGCPAGSILLCSSDDEKKVRRLRKQQGGGMRQAGVLAGACIYALENNLPNLRRTHKYAGILARGIHRSPVLENVDEEPQTNIVIAETPGGKARVIADALGSLEIGCLAISASALRFVTHLSLSESGVKYAADVLSAFGG